MTVWPSGQSVDRPFLARAGIDVAPDLLGSVIRHETSDGIVAVRRTEIEAHNMGGKDPGPHAFRGRPPRNEVIFGPAGHLCAGFTFGQVKD